MDNSSLSNLPRTAHPIFSIHLGDGGHTDGLSEFPSNFSAVPSNFSAVPSSEDIGFDGNGRSYNDPTPCYGGRHNPAYRSGSPTIFSDFMHQLDGWIYEIVAFDYDDPAGIVSDAPHYQLGPVHPV